MLQSYDWTMIQSRAILRQPKRQIIQTGQKVMSHFDQFIKYKALAFKFSSMGSFSISDMERMVESGSLGKNVDGTFVPAQSLEDVCPIPLRNVCAKLTVELVDRLDNSLSILGMSKREFIEMALIEALDKVDQELLDIDAFEFVEAREALGEPVEGAE